MSGLLEYGIPETSLPRRTITWRRIERKSSTNHVLSISFMLQSPEDRTYLTVIGHETRISRHIGNQIVPSFCYIRPYRLEFLHLQR